PLARERLDLPQGRKELRPRGDDDQCADAAHEPRADRVSSASCSSERLDARCLPRPQCWRGGLIMRLFLATLGTETNTFASFPTGIDDFRRGFWVEGGIGSVP